MNLNLRKSDNMFRPVGDPPRRTAINGHLFFVKDHGDRTSSLFYISGGNLCVIAPGKTARTLCAVGSDTDDACGVDTADGALLFTGGRRIVCSYREGSWRVDDDGLAVDPAPGPALSAVGVAVISRTMPARKLSGNYRSTGADLILGDVSALTDDFVSAWTAMEREASTLHRAWIVPVVARCRMLDADGNTVGLTPPVVLTPPGSDPVGCLTIDRPVGHDGESFNNMEASTLHTTAYRVKVEWPEDAAALWNGRVARVVVEIVDSMTPFDRSAQVAARMVRQSTSSASLRVAMPGVSVNGDLPKGYLDAVAVAAEQLDWGLCDVSPTVLIPDADGSWAEYEIDRSTLKTSTTRRVTSVDPGAFCAGTAVIGGSLALFGAPTLAHPRGFAPQEVAAATDASPWSGSVAVTFADMVGGEPRRVVTTWRGLSRRPLQTGPLIYVGDVRAVAARIGVGSSYAALSLKPTPGARGAFYLNPTLKPIDLTGGTAAVVPADNRGEPPRLPSTIFVARTSDMLTPCLSVAAPPGERIIAVAPAVRSRSSWDFGRVHFYVMTSGGIYALAVNSTRTRAEMALIDRRVIDSPHAWCSTPSGVIVAASSTLLRLDGARAGDIRTLGVPAAALGWRYSYRELWIVGNDSTVTVANLDSGYFYSRSLALADILGSGNTMTGISPQGDVCNISASETFSQRGARVICERRFEPERPPRRALWSLVGEVVNGTIEVTADGGVPEARPTVVMATRIAGGMNEPLVTPLLAPRRPAYTCRLTATVSPDTVIRNISLS